MPFESEGKEMYAVAIERLDRRTGQTVQAKIFHIHAADSGEALGHYRVIYPDRRTYRIVGAAPCIGYFAEDEHGEKVSIS